MPADSTDCGCYFVEVVSGGTYIFTFNGPVRPSGPGPQTGQSIDVKYVETMGGWVILSVTVAPGQADSVTYTTPDYDRFNRNFALSVAGQVGLLFGILFVFAGAFMLWRRAASARAGAISTSLGLISLLGWAPLIDYPFGSYGSTVIPYPVVSIAAAVGAVVFGTASRFRREQPGSFALFGVVASISSAVLIVILGISAFNRAAG